jgi:membrane fusion protein, heavy metal efflux system
MGKRIIVLLAACALTSAAASPDHDHGHDAPAAASSNAPKRQPDGSVFLPKPAQRQLQVRTIVVKAEQLPQVVELTGRVAADPNAGGKVQAMQPGRVEPGPRGLPSLGAAVRKGDVLAYVRAAESATPDLKMSLELARKKLARLEQLEGTVPQREIEAARVEVQSLTQRLSPDGGTLVAREALLAPVSGVIASANVVAGQVVEAREVLFEMVDPDRLNIEAQAFDASLAVNIADASANPANGKGVSLQFVGAGRALKEGAIPLLFRLKPKTESTLAVGQPVKVLVQTRAKAKGHAVPASAVVKNPSNLDVVWVHAGAERFEPRTVRWSALDGATVAVLDGLADGARVVVQGASLLNQVR